MRLPDRLQTRLVTLTNDLTRAADETSRRARSWTEQMGARVMQSSILTRNSQWVRETPSELQDEYVWRAGAGLSERSALQTAAPVDFTSGVMARIAAQQAQTIATPISFAGLSVEPVRVLAGTVCISAMVALTSSCVLAILAPTQALAILGWVLSVAMFILLVLRESLGLVTSLLTGSGALIVLTVLGALALMTFLRIARSGEQIVHEA